MRGNAEIPDFQPPGSLFVSRDVDLESPFAGLEVGGLRYFVADCNAGARGLRLLEARGDPVRDVL